MLKFKEKLNLKEKFLATDRDENTDIFDYLPEPVRKLVSKFVHNHKYQFDVFRIIPHYSTLNSNSRRFQAHLYELFNYEFGTFPWERKGSLKEMCRKDNLFINLQRNPCFWWVTVIEHIPKERVKNNGGIVDNRFKASTRMWDSGSWGGSNLSAWDVEQDASSEEDVDGEESGTEVGKEYRIAYYVSVPKEFSHDFKIKFSNHAQWNKSTLLKCKQADSYKGVSEDNLLKTYRHPSLESTSLYSYRYARNNMFSLDFDYSEQQLPIRDIMGMVRELSEGESLHIFVKHEAISRKRWRGINDYAWSVWEEGGVPARAGFDSVIFKEMLARALSFSVTYTSNLIEDIFRGLRGAFFYSSGESTEYKQFHFDSSVRKELLVNGDLSRRTKTKRGLPAYKTHILLAVTAKDDAKRDMLSRSFENALSLLKGDNYLVRTQIKTNVERELLKLRTFENEYQNPNIMSIEEVGKLTQLPTSELQQEYSDALVFNKRIETKVSDEIKAVNGILMGTVTERHEVYDVHIQRDNLDLASTARVVVGSPRMGKDQHVINMVVEAKRNHNMGAIILDVVNEQNGHRGMGDAIRDHLPPEDVIDINLQDFNNPVYLGLEPILKLIGDPRIASDTVAEEISAFLLQNGDEDKLQTSEYLREASKLADADLLNIELIFTSKGFRDELRAKKEGLIDTDIWDDYDRLSEAQQLAIYTPIFRRLGQITKSEYLKPIFCQYPNNKLDLVKFIDEGKVIIFRMKTGVMPRRVIEILCYWITLVTLFIKYALGGDTTKHGGTWLVLNEPHQYMTKELGEFIKRIFAEGPKYRYIPVLIFHNFEQFRDVKGFVEIMKSSSLNWHLFYNTNESVYKELFPYLQSTFETPLHAFQATKRFQYIGIWLNKDGGYHPPFVADSLPLVGDRYDSYDNAYLTEEHSKMFGRPIDEVLKEIHGRKKYAKSIASSEEDESEDPKPKKKRR